MDKTLIMVAREVTQLDETKAEKLDGKDGEAPLIVPLRSILVVRTHHENVSVDSKCAFAEARHCQRVLRKQRLGLLSDENVSVSFSSIEIRDYPICVGDNPGGTSGTPISIEWKHSSQGSIGLEEYEKTRPQRRCRSGLVMPALAREERLRSMGYSSNELRTLTRPVNIDRRNRRRTLETLQLSSLHEFNEKIARKTLNFLSFGAKKRQEKKLLDYGNALKGTSKLNRRHSVATTRTSVSTTAADL